MDSFYSAPLWLQIFIQNETDYSIRGKLRMTTKKLNNPILLQNEDSDGARKMFRLSWYYTTRDFELIADESEEGIQKYNYYDSVFTSASLFLNIFTNNV
jgi:hypothetical protein